MVPRLERIDIEPCALVACYYHIERPDLLNCDRLVEGKHFISRCIYYKSKHDIEAQNRPVPHVGSKDLLPCEAPSYKSKLIALCNGLEIQNVDTLLEKPPEYFESIGREITIYAKIGSCSDL